METNRISPDLLEILCCPETHQPVREAEAALLERLNAQAAAGTLKNRAGQLVTGRLEAGLVRADGKVLYPIRDGIPVMLVEEGISL
jgi:uncharacterized protein YbaR (Trm112 family)